jgi:hypothetical protein
MINRLIDILSREAVVFETFLELLERQKDMLVANDLDGLQRITRECQKHLSDSQELNREREALVAQIKADNAIEGDLNVSRLLELVDDQQAGRLVRLKELILNLNDKITRTRNTNAMLLNQSRDFIAKTMATLAKIQNPGHGYGASGAAAPGNGNLAVDRSA